MYLLLVCQSLLKQPTVNASLYTQFTVMAVNFTTLLLVVGLLALLVTLATASEKNGTGCVVGIFEPVSIYFD